MNIHSSNRLKIAEQLLNSIKDQNKYSLHSYIVYGSTARDEAKEDSDLDIQILVDFIVQEFMTYLFKLKSAFEEKYGIEIAINVKSVSEFTELLVRKEPLYYFILLDGKCLKKSLVFDGLRKILGNGGPKKEELALVHRQGIVHRANNIIDHLIPEFTREVKSIFLGHIKLQYAKDKPESSWEAIDVDNHLLDHSIVKSSFSQDTAQSVCNFLTISPNTDRGEKIDKTDLIKILNALNEIFQITSDH